MDYYFSNTKGNAIAFNNQFGSSGQGDEINFGIILLDGKYSDNINVISFSDPIDLHSIDKNKANITLT